MTQTSYRALSLCYVTVIVLTNCNLVDVADAKTAHGRFSFNTIGFHYLTHFGCGVGSCPWKLRVKLIKPWSSIISSSRIIGTVLRSKPAPASITLNILLDEAWESHDVNRRPSCSSLSLARQTDVIVLPVNGEWSGMKQTSKQ